MSDERIDQILAENARKLRANADYGKADYMPLNRVNQAHKSFVMIMDMIAEQHNNVSQTMVLEAIDDILSAWLEARDTREMIRYIVTSALSEDDLAEDARLEVEKTRSYLVDQGLI